MTYVRLVTCANLPAPDADMPGLVAALRDAGATVDVAEWRDPAVDWAGATVTVLRSPWDYVDAVDEFVVWVRATGERTQLWNPPALVEWNVHKSYLLDLHERGAPVVPTVVLLQDSAASLDGIADARGWNTVVVKPAVGVGAFGAGRFDVGDTQGQKHLDELLTRGDALVQPFVPSIQTEGEISVVLFDGEVSHAVRKFTGSGDYRVQENWGGGVEPTIAGDALVDLARRVCAVLPKASLYARIDFVQVGTLWHVLEAEVTEPFLWLDLAPHATERFVAATMSRVG